MANKNRAKFIGECQCCGHVQKLPNGRLSKHGYTKQWGFFSGTCLGADELPLEISKELVEDFIFAALIQKDNLKAAQAKAREVPTEQKAWVHEYVHGTGYVPSGYQWRYVDVEFVENVSQDGSYHWNTYSFVGVDGKDQKIELYSVDSKDVNTVIAHLNEKKAVSLEATVKQIDQYVAWQTDRINKWVPRELKLVEA